MDLHGAGIKFERAVGRGILFENQILKLPFLLWIPPPPGLVYLIQLHLSSSVQVPTMRFAPTFAFLHGLIKSADDASILASCGTIKREIGSGQAVADLIERVSTDAF